jgi:benzoate-CoA ligase family protein
MNLFEVIFRHGPQSPAILFEGRQISYGELRSNTLRMAKAISLLGTERNDRIALLLNDSPEFVEAFIAICSLGRIAVPINMALRIEDQRAIINNSRARAAIVEEDACSVLLTEAPETLHFPEQIVTVRREPPPDPNQQAGDHFEIADGRYRRPSTRIRTLNHLSEQANASKNPPLSSPAPDEIAFMLYTSGSTGEPKGAMHRQSDIFYTNDTFCREVLRLKQTDRLFSSSRLPFAYGLGNSFSFPLINGATSVLCREKPTPPIISKIFVEDRPTIFFAVPVVYKLLLEYHRRTKPLDCTSLRMCVSAGEALPAQLGEQWEQTFGIRCLDGIGSTEMLHMFMSNHCDDVRYGSSGKVLEGYEAKLLDEHGNPSDGDAEGNLWIKGDSAAMGYWERPEETARTFVNGWLRTGDLYRRDTDGYWFHMGRSDDCFKSSGQWVSPVEVEGVLLRHEKAGRVAVVEDFDENGLPCPCAFVVSEELESRLSLESELRDLAASALPRFKQPRKYIFVAELPYTATGKVQRFKLRQQLRDETRKHPQIAQITQISKETGEGETLEVCDSS